MVDLKPRPEFCLEDMLNEEFNNGDPMKKTKLNWLMDYSIYLKINFTNKLVSIFYTIISHFLYNC